MEAQLWLFHAAPSSTYEDIWSNTTSSTSKLQLLIDFMVAY